MNIEEIRNAVHKSCHETSTSARLLYRARLLGVSREEAMKSRIDAIPKDFNDVQKKLCCDTVDAAYDAKNEDDAYVIAYQMCMEVVRSEVTNHAF